MNVKDNYMLCNKCNSPKIFKETVNKDTIVAPCARNKSYSNFLESIQVGTCWEWKARQKHNYISCRACGYAERKDLKC